MDGNPTELFYGSDTMLSLLVIWINNTKISRQWKCSSQLVLTLVVTFFRSPFLLFIQYLLFNLYSCEIRKHHPCALPEVSHLDLTAFLLILAGLILFSARAADSSLAWISHMHCCRTWRQTMQTENVDISKTTSQRVVGLWFLALERTSSKDTFGFSSASKL